MGQSKPNLYFVHLPGFAAFVRDNHLTEFVKEQLKISREAELPLLKYLSSLSDEEILEVSKTSILALLTGLAENKGEQLINEAMGRWMANELRDAVVAEDITLVNYIRRQALLKFLPLYTTDVSRLLDIISEIDGFMLRFETACTETYINLLKKNVRDTGAKLLQSEENLLEAQEIAEMGSFDWDIAGNGNDSVYSPQVLKILELEKVGNMDSFMEYVHPSDRGKLRNAIKSAIEDNGVYECEYRYEKNNKEKVIWSRGVVVFNNGKPQRMKGSIMDITDRHHMTMRLRRSEELYKQAEALNHLGNWTWDLRQNKLQWSDELYRIYDLNVQSGITPEKAASFYHPEDRENIDTQLQKTIETHQPNDFYYRILLPEGREKIIHAKGEAMVDENGTVYKLFGTMQDVTREKLLEKRLYENQNFIKKIADTTPSVIAVYDVNTGKYAFISKALEKLLGYHPATVLDEGSGFFVNIVHPDDLTGLMEANALALEKANATDRSPEPVTEFKYRMRHKNGEYRWFHTYGTVFSRNSSGKVEQMLNISMDITDIIEAEKVLYQKNIELQQSNDNLEEFAYIASHDLKEPLRKISTFADRLLLSEQEHLQEQGRIYLEKIIESSQRMQMMISDLLSVSLITDDRSFVTYSLEHILGEVLKILEYKIDETKAHIISSSLPEARIIPSQFRQLFQNLLSNSLKFSRPGLPPVINISFAYRTPEEVADHNLAPAETYLELSFADNGIGFDNQFNNKIFAIFQRLHSRNAYEGTGIGLAICKKIAEHHGGIIFASGKPDQGALFTIIIPL